MPDLMSNWIIAIPFFLLVYWTSMRWQRINSIILFGFGLLFYSWGHFGRGMVLLVLTAVDFIIVKYAFPNKKYRKAAMFFGVGLNLSVWLANKFLFQNSWFVHSFPLLIGIAYYMLRKISFLVDRYHSVEDLDVTFLEYGLYVSFFPQILSGPIERPDKFIQQIQKRRIISFEDIYSSCKLVVLGLVKKIIIADNLRLIVDRIFQLSDPTKVLAICGAFGFALQIYGDLSGYTDLSRGFSLLLGFNTENNFNHPYRSFTPGDFWNRWHISLSRWLRVYLFSPLRRICLKRFNNKVKWLQDLLPALITMAASGIWHGNKSTFIIWGIYQGLLIFLYRITGLDRLNSQRNFISKTIKWGLNFAFIIFGWMIFRAPNLRWISRVIISASWGLSGKPLTVSLSVISMISIFSVPLILHRVASYSQKINHITEPLFFSAAVVLLIIFSGSGMQEFLYFDF